MLWKLTSISPRWWITNPRPGLLTPWVIVKLSILRGVNNQGKVCFDTELCSSWMRGGRKLRAHGGRLVVNIPYKTLCFLCILWKWPLRNFTSTTHPTCKNIFKTLLLFIFECAAGANLGTWLAIVWSWLVKIPYKTLCFCVCYENDYSETSQTQHIQLANKPSKT